MAKQWTADSASSLRTMASNTGLLEELKKRRPKLPDSSKSSIEQTAMQAREQKGFDHAISMLEFLMSEPAQNEE